MVPLAEQALKLGRSPLGVDKSNRKEVLAMTYQEPAIVALGPAEEAVQGPSGGGVDGIGPIPHRTDDWEE
jgi:hypothetical protein